MKTLIEQLKKKAVAYIRVSSLEQVEDGNSLVTQERLCREYCEKHNLDIVNIFIERGESAKTANRTELKKMLEFCANSKNQVSSLIIYKIDRLSRNTDDYSQLRILLKKYKVEIISITEKFEDSPVGRFIENTMSNVAQFDNDIRTERSVGGMKQTILEGRFAFRPPVGYKRILTNGKPDIAPSDKAYFINRIFELTNKGFSNLEEVRQQVIKEGFTLDNGKVPCKQHFYDILRNKLYIGLIVRFGEERAGLFKPVLKDKQIFWEVQKILRNNGIKSRNIKLDNPDFPLRRFVFKPDYSKKITGGWSTGRSKKYPKYNFTGAGEVGILNGKLHKMFSEFMDSFSISNSHLSKLKSLLLLKFNKATIEQRKTTAILSDRLQSLQEKENKLVNKNIEGLISDEIFKRQMEQLQSETYKCKQEMSSFNEDAFDYKELIEMTSKFLIKPSTLWNSDIPVEQKIKLQWFEFPKGITFDGKTFRTTETSFIFKAKSYNLEEFSSLVSVGGFAPPTLAL